MRICSSSDAGGLTRLCQHLCFVSKRGDESTKVASPLMGSGGSMFVDGASLYWLCNLLASMYIYDQSLIQVASTSSISLVLFHVLKVHSIHIFKFLSMNKLQYRNALFTLGNNLEMKKLIRLSQMMLVEICASTGSQWTCSIFIFILITDHSSNYTSKKHPWYSWKHHEYGK